jgi:hypothetical protein
MTVSIDPLASTDPRWLEYYAEALRRRRARGWRRRRNAPKVRNSYWWAQRKIVLVVCAVGLVGVVVALLVP